MSEISPEQIARTAHEDWLNHPSTRQAIANINKQKGIYLDALVSNSPNADTPADYFRLNSYAIKVIENVLSNLTNTNKFIAFAEGKPVTQQDVQLPSLLTTRIK